MLTAGYVKIPPGPPKPGEPKLRPLYTDSLSPNKKKKKKLTIVSKFYYANNINHAISYFINLSLLLL